MSQGCLMAVVGPSGVGKDSVMAGIAAAAPQIQLVKRCITRAPELGGEDYVALSPEEFDAATVRGGFCLHWGAHELRYGIPAQVLKDVEAGAICLANLSRQALVKANEMFPNLLVLNLTARPETLAKRLVHRGRETKDEMARRLTRVTQPLPTHLNVVEIDNDGPLEKTVAQAIEILRIRSLIS